MPSAEPINSCTDVPLRSSTFMSAKAAAEPRAEGSALESWARFEAWTVPSCVGLLSLVDQHRYAPKH
eukprot:1832283-Amphidinium_carterae.2